MAKQKNKQKKQQQKPKPMAGGVRIQQLCPALKGWRVLLLELDEDDNPVLVEDSTDVSHSLVDIAFWALMVEEDKANRYQEMLPVVPTTEGTMEPVDPEDPAYIAVVTPAEKNSDIAKMVDDYVEEFVELNKEGGEEGDDEEGGDGA